MFCERESRLNHRRTVYPAALATFDEVCEQHHEEMTVSGRHLSASSSARP
jgi:hypothetical protein